MSCPLYDRLFAKIVKDTSLKMFSIKDTLSMCDQIPNLPKDSKELIYVLIKIHSLRMNDSKYFENPYQSTMQSTDENNDLVNITFNFNYLPVQLQHMIYQFLILNKEFINEEIESRKINPVKSRAKSPTQGNAIKSFMKKNVTPIFDLKHIDVSSLDKLYSMEEIFNQGDLLTSQSSSEQPNRSTAIESLGFYNDHQEQNLTIIVKEIIEQETKKCYCQYCGLPLPVNWTEIKLNNIGFCSFNCGYAFFPSIDIYDLYKKITTKSINKLIYQSPSFLLLEEYGGYMDNREYQRHIEHNMHVSKLNQHLILSFTDQKEK